MLLVADLDYVSHCMYYAAWIWRCCGTRHLFFSSVLHCVFPFQIQWWYRVDDRKQTQPVLASYMEGDQSFDAASGLPGLCGGAGTTKSNLWSMEPRLCKNHKHCYNGFQWQSSLFSMSLFLSKLSILRV